MEKKEASTQTESSSGLAKKGVRRSRSILPVVPGAEKQLPSKIEQHLREAPKKTTTVSAAAAPLRNAILNKGKTAIKVPGPAVVQEALLRLQAKKQKKASKEPISKTIKGKNGKKRVLMSPTVEKKKRGKIPGGPAPGVSVKPQEAGQHTTQEGPHTDAEKQPKKEKIQLTMDYYLNRARNGQEASASSSSTSIIKPQGPEEVTTVTALPRKHRKRLSVVPRVGLAAQKKKVQKVTGSVVKDQALLERQRASMARARAFRYANRQ